MGGIVGCVSFRVRIDRCVWVWDAVLVWIADWELACTALLFEVLHMVLEFLKRVCSVGIGCYFKGRLGLGCWLCILEWGFALNWGVGAYVLGFGTWVWIKNSEISVQEWIDSCITHDVEGLSGFSFGHFVGFADMRVLCTLERIL